MIKIASDSTTDLGALYEERDIKVMPMSVILGSDSLDDGVTVTPKDIYKFVEKSNMLPKTAARSRQEYVEFFEKILASSDDTLIFFSLSSGLSVTYSNAKAASEEFDGRVFVVDGRSLSSGTGLLVLYACDLRDEGKLSASEIYEKVCERIPYVQASFFVDTMAYLHKGGRCSGLESFFATALKIKPSLILKEGRIVVGQKYRGRAEAIAQKYVDNICDMFSNPDLKRVFVTYTYGTDADVIKEVKRALNERYKFDVVYETTASSTITCHCGKGTIGILYINDGDKQ